MHGLPHGKTTTTPQLIFQQANDAGDSTPTPSLLFLNC
jgi:hypothetical protein